MAMVQLAKCMHDISPMTVVIVITSLVRGFCKKTGKGMEIFHKSFKILLLYTFRVAINLMVLTFGGK